jgi:hypothetical protein
MELYKTVLPVLQRYNPAPAVIEFIQKLNVAADHIYNATP